MLALAVSSLVVAIATAIPAIPGVPLNNAALAGLTMPAIGLGTGAYNSNPAVGYGGYPECWSSNGGCGAFAQTAVKTWLAAGGRRIDSANSYQNVIDVGQAIAASGVPRADIFLLSKVGPGNPLGYNDTHAEFNQILSDMGITYVDALLVHWPWQSKPQGNVTSNTTTSTDPYCNTSTTLFDPVQCRLNTWKAMTEIFASGRAKSIGVSNYNVSHFEEIRLAGMIMPAITQNPYHLYRSSTQMDVKSYADRHGIVFLGYSPFGVPDYKLYPTNLPAANQLSDLGVTAVATKYGITPAQVLLQWQWQLGIPVNPRSMSASHMADNLAIYSAGISLSQAEMNDLNSYPQDRCSFDSTWYECAY